MKKNFQKFLNRGLVREEKIDFKQVKQVLKKAYKYTESAKILLKNKDEEGGFQFAYDAMLLAGRALVFSFDLRPRAAGSHKIVVDFAEKVLGADFSMTVKKFDKMRKTRNYLIYGIGCSISGTEARNAIQTATKFIEKIEKVVQKKDPQKKLI